MKTKLLVAIVFVLFTQIGYAQVFGIKGGINIANMSFSSSGMSFSPKSMIGFHLGPVAEFNIQESLSFNTGLLYSLKGYKIDVTGESGTAKFNYLVIPLNFAYKFPINETSKFFIQAGPYLGYALSGKSKSGGVSTNVEFGSNGMKRFDFGLGVGAGVEFGSVLAGFNYELGLANVSNLNSEGKVKNKVFQVSLAYMFGGMK